MASIKFPKTKNIEAMEQRKDKSYCDKIPEEVNVVQKELEKIAPKDRKEHVFTKTFIDLCKEKKVYVVVGCTKTHSINIISPENNITVVHFFDNQTKNILKTSENVIMTKKYGILTTRHKRAKPLLIKQMNDDMINNIIADIYVGMRKIIFGNKKIGTRNIMGVWIKDYPYTKVFIGDYNNKVKDDILLFSAKNLKKYQQSEIDKYKLMKNDNYY